MSKIFLSTTSGPARLHFCVSAFRYHTLAVFQAYVSSIYSPHDCLIRFAVLIVTSVSDNSCLSFKGKKKNQVILVLLPEVLIVFFRSREMEKISVREFC